MNYTTIAVIYNPNSTGSGKDQARKFKSRIQARLPKQRVELVETTHRGHGEELAYSIATASKKPLIISSSGDGGYHDIVNGAMKARREGFHPTTGLLPAGNANDHYHNLHSDDIVDQIINHKITKVDLLKITSTVDGKPFERYAHSYIGFGLTPIIANELNQTKLNPLNEVWIVARSLFSIKAVRLEVGKKVRRYESIIFSNVDIMSKYLKISRRSSVADGKFEVTIFKRRNKLQLMMILLRASLQGVREDRRVSRFALKTLRQTLVQADGEIITLDANAQTSITIERQVLDCFI